MSIGGNAGSGIDGDVVRVDDDSGIIGSISTESEDGIACDGDVAKCIRTGSECGTAIHDHIAENIRSVLRSRQGSSSIYGKIAICSGDN